MAIVCEGKRNRVYISPLNSHIASAIDASPEWLPKGPVPARLTGGTCVPYGLDEWWKLFTPRQLVALNTFSDLVQDARLKAIEDAKAAGMADDGISLNDGGTGATAYGDALAVYLTFVVDKCSDYWSSISSWCAPGEKMRNTFGRQAIPMTWDYSECNPFCNSSGNWIAMLDWTFKAASVCKTDCLGHALQSDAQTQKNSLFKVVSTDPPYYDNIGYADLSDFFYVWMRHGLKTIFPDVFSSMATPKNEELIASPYRHGGRKQAEEFFLDGMTKAMNNLSTQVHQAFPTAIYYAFKQSDTDASGTSNAGWETFLGAVINAGFGITGTWPVRTERSGRIIGNGTNALASSIVLVCRKRPEDCPEITRRDFINELRAVMPDAIASMKGEDGDTAPVAPVDMAQAAIGPGMEIFSKYKTILKADGTPMSVHEAIIEINKFLDDGSGDFDVGTNFCRRWFDSYTWNAGPFGDADTVARAVGTSVDHVKNAGVVRSEGGTTRLIHWKDYPADYDPSTDRNRPVWEACHHMVRAMMVDGTAKAGALLSMMRKDADAIRDLAYVLYTQCERKGLSEDARAYNILITTWDDITAAADKAERPDAVQKELF